MDKDNIELLVKQKQIEEDLKQEFEQTLPTKIERWFKIKRHWITPYTHFSAASAECTLLFRDGYFYGCIALTQAVAEALVRFLCERNHWKPEKDFESNVKTLKKRDKISEDIAKSLLGIWEKRDDYHHLNPNIEKDRQKLEKIALQKINLLGDIERVIFNVSINKNGIVILSQPKYWKK